MSTSSYGSHRSPSTVFSITCGQPIISSKPSRRMFSMRTVMWSSPPAARGTKWTRPGERSRAELASRPTASVRPKTSTTSLFFVSLTIIATLVSSSCASLYHTRANTRGV